MLILRNPLLEAFDSVARLGTTHAAAKELGITQTAVTLRLKSLERGLGLTLFLRSRRGMALTGEAKALLQLHRGSRELEGRFLSQVQGERRREISLRIVGPTSAVATRITENVLPLYAKFPFLRLHLESEDHADLVEKLRRGEADLAVVPPAEVPLEMDSKMLSPDRYLLVGSREWKGRSLADILATERVIDFHDQDRTTADYLRRFRLVAGRPRLFVNENEALLRMFAAGVGFGTLTESVAAPYLKSGRLIALNRGQALEAPLALAWFPRASKGDYFESLVRAVR